jgi:hypothetical protein
MTSIFELLRSIPASDIAIRMGLSLQRKGDCQWASCPLHTDNHPSMQFYPDGRFYCHSCHTYGDSVAFYSAIYKLSPYDAAKRLANEYGISDIGSKKEYWSAEFHPIRELTGYDLKTAVDRLKEEDISFLCSVKFKAAQDMYAIEDSAKSLEEWKLHAESPLYVKACSAWAAAEKRLLQLDYTAPRELIEYYGEREPERELP